jgi:hypothetical protein
MIKESYWANFSRPTCYPSQCTCEGYYDGWIVQPSATITSIPCIILGIWILHKIKKSNPKLFLFGVSICILGISSILAHGTFTSLAFQFDFFSIILCSSYLLLYFAELNFNRWWIFKWITLTSIVYLVVYNFEPIRVYSCILYFLLVFLFWIKWYRRYLHNGYWFILSYSSLILSLILFFLDETKIWCSNPDSWIQGHSIWHLGATFGIWAIYKGICNTHNLTFTIKSKS